MAKVIKPAQLVDKDSAKLSIMVVAVLLLVLIFLCCKLRGLLILVHLGDIGLMGIFLWISYKSLMSSPRSNASKFPQEYPELSTLLPFLKITVSTRRSFLLLGSCDTQKHMKLWDILRTFVSIHSHEQDNQNAVNLQRSTRFSQLARGVDRRSDYKPHPTVHSGEHMSYTAT